MDHEKTSYVAIVGGKDVVGDDYDVDNCHDFVNVLEDKRDLCHHDYYV